MSDDRELRFLTLCDEWGSSRGGISTFNRELCIALANLGQEVCCVVLRTGDGEVDDANSHGVSLVVADTIGGAGEFDSLYYAKAALEDDWIPDVVVGHGRITGPHAKGVRDMFFKRALRAHFFHMDPGGIALFKRPKTPGHQTTETADAREWSEIDVARGAELRIGVGPHLRDCWADLLVLKEGDLLEFLPGISESEKPTPPVRPPHGCLSTVLV